MLRLFAKVYLLVNMPKSEKQYLFSCWQLCRYWEVWNTGPGIFYHQHNEVTKIMWVLYWFIWLFKHTSSNTSNALLRFLLSFWSKTLKRNKKIYTDSASREWWKRLVWFVSENQTDASKVMAALTATTKSSSETIEYWALSTSPVLTVELNTS